MAELSRALAMELMGSGQTGSTPRPKSMPARSFSEQLTEAGPTSIISKPMVASTPSDPSQKRPRPLVVSKTTENRMAPDHALRPRPNARALPSAENGIHGIAETKAASELKSEDGTKSTSGSPITDEPDQEQVSTADEREETQSSDSQSEDVTLEEEKSEQSGTAQSQCQSEVSALPILKSGELQPQFSIPPAQLEPTSTEPVTNDTTTEKSGGTNSTCAIITSSFTNKKVSAVNHSSNLENALTFGEVSEDLSNDTGVEFKSGNEEPIPSGSSSDNRSQPSTELASLTSPAPDIDNQENKSNTISVSQLSIDLNRQFERIVQTADISEADLDSGPSPVRVGKRIPYLALPVEIGMRAIGGEREISIDLSPRELGHVHVTIGTGDDNTTLVSFTVDQPQTLALLQRDAPQIRHSFDQAGINLSSSGLSFNLSQNNQSSSGFSNQGRGQEQRSPSISEQNVENSTSLSDISPEIYEHRLTLSAVNIVT